MSFLYPAFLSALACLAIPVIIHLFRFRRQRKVFFSDIRFLQELKEETDSRNRLKHLLVLLCRLLALTFLVLAFAQPFLPIKPETASQKGKSIAIFIDNSFSMANIGERGALVDEAKEKAREIVLAYPQETKFQLLTHDFEARHQRFLSKEEMLEMIPEVKATGNSRDINQIMQRLKDVSLSTETPGASFFFISDFQKSGFEGLEEKSDARLNLFLLPLEANPVPNLSIDSLWFSEPVQVPGTQTSLFARIVNFGQQDATEVPVKLMINGKQRAVTNLSLAPGEQKQINLNFLQEGSGLKFGELVLDDQPVRFDNKFYFSYPLESNVKVLDLHQGATNPYIKSLFSQDSTFAFESRNESNPDFSTFGNFDLIVLNQFESLSSGLINELVKFREAGHHLLIFPPAKISDAAGYVQLSNRLGIPVLQSTADTSDTRVESVNYNHRIFQNVFDRDKMKGVTVSLPRVTQHYSWMGGSLAEETLISLENRRPLFARFAYSGGAVYLSAVAPEENFGEFHKHSLFVPTLFNVALYSKMSGVLYQTIGKELPQPIGFGGKGRDEVFHLRGIQQASDLIPPVRKNGFTYKVDCKGIIQNDGNYVLMNNNDSLSPFSFNFQRKESQNTFFTDIEATELFKKGGYNQTEILRTPEGTLTKTLQQWNEGIVYWKFCVIIALFFVILEILLIRWLL